MARVRLLTTHRFLARQVQPSRVEVELLSVEEVIGPTRHSYYIVAWVVH